MRKPGAIPNVVQFCFIAFVYLIPLSASGQQITCDLTNVTQNSILGTCRGIIPPILRLEKSNESNDVLWEGSASEGNLVWPLDIATSQNTTGEELVVRYEMGWYYIDEFSLEGSLPILVWSMSNEVEPSEVDIAILESAILKLDKGNGWDIADDRSCTNTESTSIYCALLSATSEVMGKPYHRQPAIQAIRRIIGERWPDRISDHRLMDFNNNPNTDFDDVVVLFNEAKISVLSTMK